MNNILQSKEARGKVKKINLVIYKTYKIFYENHAHTTLTLV